MAKTKRVRKEATTEKLSGRAAMREMVNRGKTNGTRRERTEYFKISPGKTYKLRFLPNPDGDDVWAVFVQRIWNVAQTDSGKSYPMVSPKTENKDAFCPAQALFEKYKDGDSAQAKAIAKDLRPEKMFLANALVYVNGKWEQHVVRLTGFAFECMYEQIVMYEDDLGEEANIASADNKVARLVQIKGGGNPTRWTIQIGQKEPTMQITQEMLDACVPLGGLEKVTPAAEIEDAVCSYMGVDTLSAVLGDVVAAEEGEDVLTDSFTDDEEADVPWGEDDDLEDSDAESAQEADFGDEEEGDIEDDEDFEIFDEDES